MRIYTEHRVIARDEPPYLIAEIGLNHNGDRARALALMRAARDAGAHAAKFQLFRAEEFIAPDAALGENGPGSLADFFRTFEFSPEVWKELAAYARSLGLDFLCSVFDETSLRLYGELEGRAVKIASGDLTHRLLLEKVALLGLPVLLSAGMAAEEEIAAALALFPRDYPLVLMECVSSYPADPADYNLNALPVWEKKFGVLTGISDHCLSSGLSIAAVGLGARVIEKHFTIDKNLPGADHGMSLEPGEFGLLAREARSAFLGLGDGKKRCRPREEPVRESARRSLRAARDIPAGAVLGRGDLLALRPGGGIPPGEYGTILGKKIKKDLRKGEFLSSDNLWQ